MGNPLAVDLNKLLEIHVPELPVGWKRTRGTGSVRWTPEDVRVWKEYVAEVARDEISSLGEDESFPTEARLFVSINVYYEEEKRLNRASDSDNIAKAILDALNGVIWKDDKPRYVRGHSVWMDLAPEESAIGTYIVVYEV